MPGIEEKKHSGLRNKHPKNQTNMYVLDADEQLEPTSSKKEAP